MILPAMLQGPDSRRSGPDLEGGRRAYRRCIGAAAFARVLSRTLGPGTVGTASMAFSVTCLTSEHHPGPAAADPSLAPPHSPVPPDEARPTPSVATDASVDSTIDSVHIDAVSPVPGAHLPRGDPLPFNIELTYNLVSADSADASHSCTEHG